MTTKVQGYLFGVIAAASYGTNPLFALPLYADGMDTDSVLFLRYALAVPILAVMAHLRGQRFSLPLRAILPVATIGIIAGISSLTLFLSYRYMEASIASTMLFVYPIMVAVIMAVMCRERLPWLTYVCLLVALIGLALLYKSDDGTTLSPIGTTMVLASALTYSIYLVAINLRPLKDIATITITMYVMLFGAMLYAMRMLWAGQMTLPSEPWLWGNVVALAVLPTAISLSCTAISIQAVGSTPTAILGVLEPLTATLIGVLVFNEALTGRDVAGLLLIVIAVTCVIAEGKITHHMLRFRKLFPKFYHKRKRV